jgi:hypothetical protein
MPATITPSASSDSEPSRCDEAEAARLVWKVRRRGLKPLPGITHAVWIASVARWLRGSKRTA